MTIEEKHRYAEGVDPEALYNWITKWQLRAHGLDGTIVIDNIELSLSDYNYVLMHHFMKDNLRWSCMTQYHHMPSRAAI